MGVGMGLRKFWGRWGTAPVIGGVASPLETRLFLTCVTVPNLVVLGQTIRT